MTKGNVKAQRKRRKRNLKGMPRTPTPLECIDGNFSYYTTAYCRRKGAYLTQGLSSTHRCKERKCEQYEEVYR